ncbi:MAG: hypothetical protein M1455_10630 [Actinobacteria bacterium]|nr:hypothetical protein [Actinomycetota bacterium]
MENLIEMQRVRLKAAVMGAATVVYRRGRLELGDIRLENEQRQALEEAELQFAYHPLRRLLVLWPPEEESLSTLSTTLDAIIDRLFTSVANL